MAWHTLVIPDAQPKVASTLAGLGSGQYDGHVGIVRIGSGVDAYQEEFIWDTTARSGAGGWIGTQEHIVLTTDDAWALDWTRQPLSAVRNAWARPNGGVGWARSGAAAILRTDFTIPGSGTINIPIDDAGAAALPPQGQVTMRGMVFTYSAIAGSAGSQTLTCPAGQGTAGVALKANYTPIIPYSPVVGGGGDPGGWGTTVAPLDHVGEMWSAGFRLQERMHAWMNGSQDLKRLSIAPFYNNYNLGEDYLYPTISDPPVSGMLGSPSPGITLIGPAEHMAGITSPGTGTVVDERRFQWVEGNWSTWASAAPTKRVLIPTLYGKMPADAEDTGQAYGVTLALRWVQP